MWATSAVAEKEASSNWSANYATGAADSTFGVWVEKTAWCKGTSNGDYRINLSFSDESNSYYYAEGLEIHFSGRFK